MIFETVLGAAATYLIDVPLRRERAARAARAYAYAKGKPLLNVGAGTNGAGLWSDDPRCKAGSSACYPATLYGDVNVDITGRKDVPHGTPGIVTYADVYNLPFPDGSFGAVLASHVLEHLDRPTDALQELLRVVGGDRSGLFIVTPAWWTLHAWLQPGHKWYFPDGAGCVTGCVPMRIRR